MSTFNEPLVHELCLQYRRDHQPATLTRIDHECDSLFHAIIKLGQHGDPDAQGAARMALLRQGLRGQLPLWIGQANFKKGRAGGSSVYAYFSTCARSYCLNHVPL